MFIAEIPWHIFTTPFGIPITAIVATFSWLIVHSISESVTKLICNRNDADLKSELLARGFSSDEIVRTIESGRDQRWQKRA